MEIACSESSFPVNCWNCVSCLLTGVTESLPVLPVNPSHPFSFFLPFFLFVFPSFFLYYVFFTQPSSLLLLLLSLQQMMSLPILRWSLLRHRFTWRGTAWYSPAWRRAAGPWNLSGSTTGLNSHVFPWNTGEQMRPCQPEMILQRFFFYYYYYS